MMANDTAITRDVTFEAGPDRALFTLSVPYHLNETVVADLTDQFDEVVYESDFDIGAAIEAITEYAKDAYGVDIEITAAPALSRGRGKPNEGSP